MSSVEGGDEGAQKGLEPSDEAAEIVTGGGHDGIGAVVLAALELVAVNAVLGLEVSYCRFDCGPDVSFLDGWPRLMI